MDKSLRPLDVVALGFMTFAFFLGAGNMIFPPLAGFYAGDNLLPAIIGFLLTAVGLPLLGLLAIAKASGGLPTLGRFLPKKASTLLGLTIYLILVPAFGIPRTALVAYEMAVVPFADSPGVITLALFTLVYFSIALFFALQEGKLIDNVGKIIAPILLLLLIIVGVGVLVAPQGEIGVAQVEYANTPFTKGVLDGYMTMDALAALMFGLLIIHALRNKGVNSSSKQFKYLSIAGLIAGTGLALVYIALFYLGATSHLVTPNPDNGGQIFTEYVAAIFGSAGQVVLAAVVSLACLTTAIGGISAFGEYINDLNPKLNYRWVVMTAASVCLVVANIGLSELISISTPILMAVYPVAMALVLLTLVSDRLRNPQLTYAVTLSVALIFGVFDGISTVGVDLAFLDVMPMFDEGLAWVLPTLIAFVVSACKPVSELGGGVEVTKAS
ncbi:branched-chain amino acid transport system II carrier protein [Alkalimarinus alittae]|uniref:Branched-chain amino acid transport system carrier protein n=1 Tax=Alkalimarinus alittae TaxID=2961619 RepID=A0ABY6MYW1_9ALTE|nr:branched-chain amino acid transport system II carrier protein [Alkalimarinus alittae]UZE95023.1 branched-chain amino acid transport system II carrier protein [Alkalimarinus alittae]